MPLTLTPEDRRRRQRFKDDFPAFAADCLKIRTKSGTVQPLVLNRAQRALHERLEAQRAATGKVRALLLKARQQGFSTYVQARFYWRLCHARGLQAFILTHQRDATDTLFGIAERLHANCPEAIRPSTGKANARTLTFERMDCGYSVGTAGAEAVGRSKTVQLFHGSEAAFWKNGGDHFAGVIQAVPDQPGSEIIIETTGNGPEGEFFERWQRAQAGLGDYQAIFVPWFWSAEYRRQPPEGFHLDEEEAAHAAVHGLDAGQMAWRRAKLAELRDPLLFMQEYPATPHEAFQRTDRDSFIAAERVLEARRAKIEGVGPLVIGVDPKREGTDRFCIAWRKGRQLLKVEGDAAPIDTLAAAGRIKTIIDAEKPARVFMDVGGNGGGIGDVLRSWGEPYASVVTLVNFGSAPLQDKQVLADGSIRPGPKNRRAEMWAASRTWLEDPGGADIPDLDALQADACGPGYSYDVNQRLVLESKEHMASRGVRSPDGWDAVALTFAEPVAEPRMRPAERRIRSWMA